ncbi:MAG TPA: PLP-dependent aminotransferase family protein [Candidatus Acidoferrum sp.]|nr:PLP-dependent aminotransferase family protein [Candidatus Acidoferrum sp.]
MPFNSFENYPMSWRPELDKDGGCLYRTLAGQLERDIAAGVLKPGTRLPPQRELADFLDVNLSTVSKAFRLCAQNGLLSSRVGSGTYVAYDALTSKRLLPAHRGIDIVDMGATVPGASGSDMVMALLKEMLGESGVDRLLGYHLPEEHIWQKEVAVSLMARCGHHTDRERILFANGGQNALVGVLAALFKRGETLAVDGHTFPGVKSAAGMLGIRLEPLPQDDGGTDPHALELACRNKKIAGIYVISACHNPTTITMPQGRRRELAQVARQYGCLVIEDGTYQPLAGDTTPVSVSDYAPESSIYIASLSKSVAPGLRMAYLSVPPQHKAAVSDALYTINASVAPMMAELSARIIASGRFEAILENHIERVALRNALVDRWLPNDRCLGGGTDIIRWLLLPAKFTGTAFERLALSQGVRIYAAEKFTVGKTPPAHAVRLSICAPQDPEELGRGLEVIARLIG